MPATVQDRDDVAFFVPRDDNFRVAQSADNEIAGIFNLGLVAEKSPRPEKNLIDFNAVNIVIDEGPATDRTGFLVDPNRIAILHCNTSEILLYPHERIG